MRQYFLLFNQQFSYIMAYFNLADAFKEFRDTENVDRQMLMKIIEEMFMAMIKKKYDKYGTLDYFDITINTERGELDIFRKMTVVAEEEEVEDARFQITVAQAEANYGEGYEEGDEVYETVDPKEFGRRAILMVKQLLASKLGDLKRNALYSKYKERAGEIITAEVYQTWKKETLLLDDDQNDLILPKSEQIPGDFFKKGDMVKAILKKADFKNSMPSIILSRTHPEFLRKLLEIEVPEILEGVIVIKKVVRDPGRRSKVAVESLDDRIDPVGACVGIKGSRIHGIVRELRNENIDIVNWTSNSQLFIQRALNPARITSMKLNMEDRRADVYVNPEDISMVIGQNGVNIRLACMLTDFDISVYRNDEEVELDIELDEFNDEIEQWILDAFKNIGCETARSVLALDNEFLEQKTDLEIETIEEVKRILREEMDKS